SLFLSSRKSLMEHRSIIKQFYKISNLKSSPAPILFIPFNDSEEKCNYCENEYSWTSTKQIKQKYCKKCLFEYKKNMTNSNTYLDICETYLGILHFNQLSNNYILKLTVDGSYYYPNFYLILSEWIESAFTKKLIPILYLPWWDTSDCCIACWKHL